MTQEALTMALEALEFIPKSGSMLGTHAEAKRLEAITAIKKALAQRTWVGLTNQEIDSYFEDHGYSTSEYYYPVIKDIEAKLKEKNT